MSEVRSLSQLLLDFCQDLKQKQDANISRVQVDDILDAFHERGFGMILFFFALPMALPIPVPPGINVLLASPLILLTGQQMLGFKEIWMPQSMRRKTISSKHLISVLTKAIPFVRKIEILARPRLGFLTQGISSHLIGLFGLIMALTICIPIPLTNTVPSLGIACMAVGVLMRDGLAVIAGAIVGLAWISLLVFLGEAGLRFLIGSII